MRFGYHFVCIWPSLDVVNDSTRTATDEAPERAVEALADRPTVVGKELVAPDMENNPEDPVPSRRLVVRVGTFMLKVPCETPPKNEIIESLKRAIESDVRVSSVELTDQRPEWMRRLSFFPTSEPATKDQILSGSDHFHCVTLSDPILITIHVPKKNQPKFMGYSDHPSDSYFVAWDGLTAVVAYEAPVKGKPLARAAGQIVPEVLADCAKKAGLGLHVQACSPSCKNLFTHTDVVLEEFSGSSRHELQAKVPGWARRVYAPASESGLDAACQYLRWISQSAYFFASFKNSSARINDLDRAASDTLRRVLGLQYRRASTLELPSAQRIRAAWTGRHDGRIIRKSIGQLWLFAAVRESLLDDWNDRRDRFHDLAGRQGYEDLFAPDLLDSERSVSRRDPSLITQAVSQVSTGLDARLIAIVTAIAGLSAILGAVIGAALH